MVIQASHSAVSASLQSLILSSPSNLQNSWNYSSLVGRERSGVIEFSLKNKCSEHFSWVSSLLLPSCTLSSSSLLDFSPFNSSSPFSLFPSIYRNFPKSKKSKTERRRCRDFFFFFFKLGVSDAPLWSSDTSVRLFFLFFWPNRTSES